jgi:hypothetical protein
MTRKKDDEHDEVADSIKDMAARKAQIQAEAAEVERMQSEEEARQRQARIDRDLAASEAEARFLEHQVGLVHDGETREQLLDRVRKLRETPAAPAYVPPPPTAFQQEQINIEQEAGRQAVARAEKEQARVNELRKKAEEERLAREGEMHTLQHPNPGQNEKFPTNQKAK